MAKAKPHTAMHALALREEQTQAWIQAAEHLDFSALSAMLALPGVDPRLVDVSSDQGATALTLAARANRCDILALLLLHGADPDASAPHILAKTPLAEAAHANSLDALRHLINAGANLSKTSWLGFSPLGMAARAGSPDAISLLLKAGAIVDQRGEHGQTPAMALLLHGAHNGASPEDIQRCLALLIQAGCEVNARDFNLTSLLIHSLGRADPLCVSMLLAAGAHTELSDSMGWTPVFHAMLGSATRADEDDCPWDDLALLLGARCNLNVLDHVGLPLLLHLVHNGDARTLQTLLSCGLPLNINIQSPEGLTAVKAAVSSRNHDQLALLIQAGCDIELSCPEGRPPLHTAAWNGDVHALGMLLSAGADMDRHDWEGWTPLMQAAWSGHVDCVELLMDAGANMTALNPEGKDAAALAGLRVAAHIRSRIASDECRLTLSSLPTPQHTSPPIARSNRI